MTVTLSTNKKIFKFTSDFDHEVWCEIEITIELKQYQNSNMYYYINYNTTYSDGNEINEAHPFYNIPHLEDHTEGEIIYKNELTDKITEYLLMDDTELANHLNSITFPQTYRGRLMITIANLWD